MTTPTLGTWKLDPTHFEIGFKVRHAGVSKVRGTFDQADAAIEVKEDFSASETTATVQVASLNTRNDDRDGHLKSEDFFDVEKYPTMSFKSTSFQVEGEDLTVEGELTIKDQTRPVILTGEFGGVVVDPFGTTRMGISASTVISRKEFGITWNAALEAGGVMIGDKVTVNIDGEFVAPESQN